MWICNSFNDWKLVIIKGAITKKLKTSSKVCHDFGLTIYDCVHNVLQSNKKLERRSTLLVRYKTFVKHRFYSGFGKLMKTCRLQASPCRSSLSLTSSYSLWSCPSRLCSCSSSASPSLTTRCLAASPCSCSCCCSSVWAACATVSFYLALAHTVVPSRITELFFNDQFRTAICATCAQSGSLLYLR